MEYTLDTQLPLTTEKLLNTVEVYMNEQVVRYTVSRNDCVIAVLIVNIQLWS